MKKCCLLLFVFTIVLFGSEAILTAQEVTPKDQMPMHNADNSRHQKMRAMMRWRLVEYLDLNEEQSANFFPIMKESDETHDKIIKERKEIVRNIMDTVDDTSVSVKEIKKYVNRLETLKNEMQKAHNNFLKKSEKILDDRQYIKLLIFEDKIKEDLFLQYRDRRARDKSRND